MSGFNMHLLHKRRGDKITVYLRNPKEGLDVLTFFPYWIEEYENLIVIEHDATEERTRTWIPLSEIFRIEEYFDKTN